MTGTIVPTSKSAAKDEVTLKNTDLIYIHPSNLHQRALSHVRQISQHEQAVRQLTGSKEPAS